MDRRKIEQRITELKKELEEIGQERETQRKRRIQSRIPQVGLVGYTNAGKSTIMNRMVEAYGDIETKKVLEKDMLFATLETAVRNIDTGDNKPFFLVDTVGFIHNLPHGLIKAFQATLEEAKHADLLVQVIDYSDPNYKKHIEVTEKTLVELQASDIPMIYVFNKSDRCGMNETIIKNNSIYISAKSNWGIEELIHFIKQYVYADHIIIELLIPYTEGAIVSYFMENATIQEQEYREDGVYLKVECHSQDCDKYNKYVI